MKTKRQQTTIGRMVILLLLLVAFVFAFSSVKTYAASWEEEDNDSRARADSISLNGSRSGNISEYEDFDYYKFSIASAGKVQIKFTHNYVADEDYFWDVYLTDSTGSVYTSKSVGGTGTESALTTMGLPAGTYYIRVNAYEYGYSGDYSTATYTVTAGFSESTVWETEWNETRPTADNVVVNKAYYGNISEYEDFDYYKFTTTKSGKVQVKFTHNYVADEDYFWDVYLTDSTGSVYTSKSVGGTGTKSALTTMGLPAGTYYIRVNAYEYGYSGDYSTATYTVTAKWTVPGPTGLKVTNKAANGKPKVTWNAVKGADKYEVWRKIGSSGTWKKQYTTTGREYVNTSAEVGKKYYYKVRAVFMDTDTVSEFSTSDYVTCDLAKPTGLKVATKASNGKPDVSWKKVSNADKYEVWRKVGSSGTWKKQYTTKGTSYTNTSAVAGKVYYYKVKAVYEDNTTANSAFSASDYVTCDLARPKITVSGTKKPGRIVISWSKVSGADRYYIYRATSKNGTYEYYDSTRSTSYTNSSVREGKYYYYKVKAVYDDRSAANSAYSNMDYAWVR